MSIDGIGAPEGATHYGPDTDSHCEAWYRVVDGKITAFVTVGEHPFVLSPAQHGDGGYYHAIDELVEIWMGDGIPPVGVVCEGLNGCNQWVRCMVLHHTLHIPPKALAVYGDLEDGLASFYGWRPIRTPEQIAKERLQTQLGSLAALIMQEARCANAPMEYSSALSIANTLMIDGYRKQSDQ